MELSGYDSVIFTVIPPRKVYAGVFRSVLARWPTALVCDWDGPEAGEPLANYSLDRFSEKWTQLQFYRDAAMLRHMETAPYQPMADGEGPFAVLSSIRREVEFGISHLDEGQSADRKLAGMLPPDPYPAWLCAPTLTSVTTVTPGDPAAWPFARWVLEEVKRACRIEPGTL